MRVHVVVNPAAGQNEPVLNTLNNIFHPAGVNWAISVTKKANDASNQARAAATAGVDAVMVYGGDGTVMEVATALIGSDVPMAILPGGTANVVSVELDIPRKLAEAAAMAIDPKSGKRQIDVGQCGDNYFLHRVGIGFAAAKVAAANREVKDKYGRAAYAVGAVDSLHHVVQAEYHLVLDGESVTYSGVTCHVANSGNLGVHGVSYSHKTSISDGLLDVMIAQDIKPGTMSSVAAGMVDIESSSSKVYFHQASKISVSTDPVQPVQGDGEMWGETPVMLTVLPRAVTVIVPRN